MKLHKLVTVLTFFSITFAIGQNNSYPTSGDVKIFAGGSSWGEGISIVKSSGWSGLRLTRNDPASGNYNGNWALGYNASTGNDFSISTNYNGTLYDGLFHISNSTRNVGIGTTAPGSLLHLLNGAPVSVQGLNASTKFTIDAASGGFAEFRNTADNNTQTGLLFTDNNLGGYVTFRNYPDDKLHLGAYSGIAFEVGTDNNVALKAERMRIDANGNVGIGTSTPQLKLHIAIDGSSTTSYPSISTSDIGLMLQNKNSTNNNLNILSFGDASAWGVAHIGTITNHTNHSGKLFFATRPSGSGLAQRMLIDENGNVGIGTTNPNQKLTVNGTIYGKEVKVDLSVPGPDYVFDKDYQLTSLEDIKTYIDQHKHLPEVPSAAAMEANGINLSEMNMILLKKIEELTLHLIQQANEVKELRQENEKQNEIIKSLINKER